MLVPNLPAIDGQKFQGSKARGVWEANNLNLDSLASSLAIPIEAGRTTDLKSIPDVWAQFQGFADAFEFKNHPQHERVISQWRALISLIALSSQYSNLYELEFKPIKLDAAATNPQTKKFADVLRHLIPQIGKRPFQADWNIPVLMFVRKKTGARLISGAQLIGLLNPATLVAVGKGADELRVDGVPWLREGLADPTSAEALIRSDDAALNRRDFSIISSYLESLYERLRPTGQSLSDPGSLFQELINEIDSFHARCVELVGSQSATLAEARISSASSLAPPYNFLSFTYQTASESSDPTLSECFISARPGSSANASQYFNGIILVDERLTESLGRRLNDIKVWKQFYLHEALQKTVFDAIKAEALREGIFVTKPQDFFTDELVIFEEGAEVPGHGFTNGFRNAAMPVSPLTLFLLEPAGLNTNIRLTISGANVHKVELTVTLQASGMPHVVQKEFSPDADDGNGTVIFDQPRTMGIGLWPDFQVAGWKWNFLRFGYDPKSRDLVTRFGVSGRYLEWLMETREPSERLTAIEQLADANRCRFVLDSSANVARERVSPVNASPIDRLRYTATDRQVEELQLSEFPYEAICFARRRKAGEEPKPAGLVLLPNTAPRSSTGGASVAIDFGTTNTVAYFRGPNSGTSERVVLQDRVVIPVKRSQGDLQDRDDEKWAFGDFMPPSQNPMPIPTVAKLPAITSNGDAGLERVKSEKDDRALFSSVSFFLPSVPGLAKSDERYSADTAALNRIRDQLRFDLKWRDDSLGRDTASRYLRQKMIMIGAELVGTGYDPKATHWRFSYPEAIPDPEQFTSTLSARMLEVFGPPNSGNNWEPMEAYSDAPGSLEAFTEAEAAAAYFLASERTPGQASIVLDIGGRTTDVVFQIKSKLRWKMSFKLAGGDFFTNYLFNNPDFFGEGLHLRDMAEIVRGKPPRELLELMFYDRRFPTALDQRYNSIAQDQGAGLRHAALLALSGMLYYVGIASRKLISQREIDHTVFEGMTVALGGRGAEIFRRFAQSTTKRKSRLERALNVFPISAGLDPEAFQPRVNMSDDPKSEVALGMLKDPDAEDQSENVQHIPIGEVLQVRRSGAIVQLAEDTEVSALANVEIDGRPKLSQLYEFLGLLEEQVGISVELTPFGRQHVADTLASDLARSLKKAKEIETARAKRVQTGKPRLSQFEPPFITALKTIVEIATKPKLEREKYMEIREER